MHVSRVYVSGMREGKGEGEGEDKDEGKEEDEDARDATAGRDFFLNFNL